MISIGKCGDLPDVLINISRALGYRYEHQHEKPGIAVLRILS